MAETSPTRSCSVTENSGNSGGETADRTAKRSWSARETVRGSNLFVIKGYSVAKGIGVGKCIASEKFTVGGCEWAIYVYPNGKNPEDNSSHVSVFIGLARECRDVRALFELTLIDQSGKGNHKVHTCFNKSLPHTLHNPGGRLWGYQRFFRRARLETSDYLRDDCLKIYYTVGVVDSTIDCSRLRSIQIPDSDIGSHIGMLLENVESCDITFNVSGEKVHAHKLIVGARCPKFRSELLEGVDIEKKEVMVPDMDPKVFKALLHFIYRDALPENELIASSSSSAPLVADTLTAKLLAAADRYDVKRLKGICESHMCKDISVNSVTQVLALADRYDAAELKDVCLKFAAKHLAAVGRSDGFKYFEENCPALKSELLNCVFGCVQDCSNGGGTSGSVRAQLSGSGGDNGGGTSGSVMAQLSDGGDNGRRVRQRVEELSSNEEGKAASSS